MRLLWRRREIETSEDDTGTNPLRNWPERDLTEGIRPERDASRVASISRIAEEIDRRGARVVELFKEVVSPDHGRAVLPIHAEYDGEDVFVEVEARPWEPGVVRDFLHTAAALRGSEHSGARLEIVSAYPIPDEVRPFRETPTAALLQLDLAGRGDRTYAEAFADAAGRHLGLDLDYGPDGLAVLEERLLGTLREARNVDGRDTVPVLDDLVLGFGLYAGEVLRRGAVERGWWWPAEEPGEDPVVEFVEVVADPVGKARAFFENGPEDSVAFYVDYALEELNGPPEG